MTFAWKVAYISDHNGDFYGEEIVYTDSPETKPVDKTTYYGWDFVKRFPEKDKTPLDKALS